MTHLAFQTLLEYIEEQLSPSERTRVEKHLAGCSTCQSELESVREMLDGLANEQLVAPEPTVLQRTVAAFRRRKQQIAERVAQVATLEFDSRTAGAVMGARGVAGGHQLLYSFDPFDLDLQISREASTNTSTLYGQILSDEEEMSNMVGIPLRLSGADEDERLGLTDELGRFSFAYLRDGEYTLRVTFDRYDLLIRTLTITP